MAPLAWQRTARLSAMSGRWWDGDGDGDGDGDTGGAAARERERERERERAHTEGKRRLVFASKRILTGAIVYVG
jgi:hypothetical protein